MRSLGLTEEQLRQQLTEASRSSPGPFPLELGPLPFVDLTLISVFQASRPT